ncbi:MAG: replication restart helicase PriA [Candidatus Limnocylindrales bacterium]
MAAARHVEVAVDAAGAGGERAYTYLVPEALADVAAGEAVVVGFGRRQALGIVLGDVPPPAGIAVKPILERVRTDGPLLPPLTLALARWIAAHYLAPPAVVVRAMLPPGLLERLELRVFAVEGRTSEGLPQDAVALLREAGAAGIAARRLATSVSQRPALLRALHVEAQAGRLGLAWVLRGPEVRPRVERRARITPAGRAALGRTPSSPAGHAADAPRLGVRQRAVLEALAAEEPDASVAAAGLADRHGGGALTSLARRGLLTLEVAVHERRPLPGRAERAIRTRPLGSELTSAQAAAAEAVVTAVQARRAGAFLLEGTTAAGKTAVYVRAIEAALELGRGVLVLVPEIALAAPLLDRLRTELAEPVALVHGGLSAGERADEWRRIRRREVRVVVGTRTALLAPLDDVGLVVVDEEHDPAYKADRTPRYQARDAALELGRLAEAPVLLASATPDVVSWARARDGGLTPLRLDERVAGREPSVELVDLRAELAAGNRSLLSRRLADALGALDPTAGERAILVLNRRGSASVVLCRDCGYVQVCPECQRPLVYHAVGHTLRCHHCGASAPVARRCPACGSARIRYLGGGTERLQAEVAQRFPELRIGRLDRDVAERKGAAERVIDAFTDGELDVLVGTSLVTKGLDVPGVVLVGIVSADIALSLPDERAAERTYQLLRQAVGRAGRGERPGRAIVQTYLPDHPALRAVASGDAATFYAAELAARRAFGSPPFGRLIKLTVGDPEREGAEAEGRRFADVLRARARAAGQDTIVLGPAPAYIARRGGRWRFHVVLRGSDPRATLGGDPGAPWSVDVDPESLL